MLSARGRGREDEVNAVLSIVVTGTRESGRRVAGRAGDASHGVSRRGGRQQQQPAVESAEGVESRESRVEGEGEGEGERKGEQVSRKPAAASY